MVATTTSPVVQNNSIAGSDYKKTGQQEYNDNANNFQLVGLNDAMKKRSCWYKSPMWLNCSFSKILLNRAIYHPHRRCKC